MKLKGQVTSQQDNLLNERQSAIKKAQAENVTLRNELATIRSEMEDKKKKVSAEEYSAVLCWFSIIVKHRRCRLSNSVMNLLTKIAWVAGYLTTKTRRGYVCSVGGAHYQTR